MSTVELLKQVEALPAREREKFLLALLNLKGKPTHAKRKKRRVTWPNVEERAKRIFGNRVLPNLVLLERQEEAVRLGTRHIADRGSLVPAHPSRS
jgi:hypothetical protein